MTDHFQSVAFCYNSTGSIWKRKGGRNKIQKKSQAPPVSQPQPLPTLSHTGEDEAAGSSDHKECSPTYPWAVIPESTVIGEPLIWNLKSFEFLLVSRFGLDHHGDPYRHTASLNMGVGFTGRTYYGILTAYEYRDGSACIFGLPEMSDMVTTMKLFLRSLCVTRYRSVHTRSLMHIHAAIGVYYIQHKCVLCTGSVVLEDNKAPVVSGVHFCGILSRCSCMSSPGTLGALWTVRQC